MNSRNSMLRHYYQTICSYLPCSGKLKKQILTEIRTNISKYLEEFPEAEFSQIEVRFGTPKSIAAAYVDDMDTQELLHALRIRRKITAILIAAVLVILAMWGAVVSAAYIDARQEEHGYSESYIVDLSTEPATH